MQRISKLALAFFSCAVFFGGAVNLYPCAAGSATLSAPKKSCHGSIRPNGLLTASGSIRPAGLFTAGSQATTDEQKPKSEKPCCSLHCYNPATVQALVKVTPPARTAIALRHAEHPHFSLTTTPPLPPPRTVA